jgi:hypothetical protein
LLALVVIVSKPQWRVCLRDAWILLALFAYLIIHLALVSTDFPVALDNFQGTWLKIFLFSAIGAGAGLLFARNGTKNLIFLLGVAFSVPLVNFLYACRKVLRGNF